MNDAWWPLFLSLRIAIVATFLAALVGVPLAYAMARRRFTGKSLLEALILVPLVLPPTVIGYFILIIFGTRGWVGRYLDQWFGYSIIFRFEAAVLAAAVVAVPLLYLPAKAAFASVDRDLEDVARLMGANRFQLFWWVSIPLARRGLASGLLLAFARALGEFGATVMVLGWQRQSLTLPISVYTDYVDGDLSHALPAVLLLTGIALALVVAYNVSSTGTRE